MQQLFDELTAARGEREFASLPEAESFVEQFMHRRNSRPVAEFDGLSPSQMRLFLDQPFAIPDLAFFPPRIVVEPQASAAQLFHALVSGIDEKGLKGTAKGNLPRNFCRAIAQQQMGESGYAHFTRYGGINSELDYRELHVTRILAEAAGLLRTRGGRFHLTRKCKVLMDGGSMTEIFPLLLRTHAERYEWGYLDRYPDLRIVQSSVLFTLRMLQQHGGEERSSTFYEERFERAFPAALRELPEIESFPRQRMLSGCFRLRALERFAKFFGLIELRPIGKREILADDYRVRSLPLLGAVVRFRC